MPFVERQAREAERNAVTVRLDGPLHGVPVAIKDLSDQKAGVPNSFGSNPSRGVNDLRVTFAFRIRSRRKLFAASRWATW